MVQSRKKIIICDSMELKKGLNTFGLVDPLIIDLTDNNTIIGGHQRLEALKSIDNNMEMQLIRLGDIGLVIKDTDLKIKDKNDQKALNLALNKINGEWDYSKLDDVLLELTDANYVIELTGFDDLEIISNELTEDIREWDNIDNLELENKEYEKTRASEKTEKRENIIICPHCNKEIEL